MAVPGAYKKLLVAVVLDPRLTADGLAMVAYRVSHGATSPCKQPRRSDRVCPSTLSLRLNPSIQSA
jgi:hypothetical protein